MMNLDEFWTKLSGKRARRLSVNSALLPAMVAAIYLVYVVTGLGSDRSPDLAAAPVPETVLAQQEVSTPDYLQISAWHLFGTAESDSVVETAIAETQAQLKLLGTLILSKSPETRSAIIQADDGSQKKYKIGDSLPDGAVVEDIAAKKILLSRNGQREALTLQRLDADVVASAESVPTAE